MKSIFKNNPLGSRNPLSSPRNKKEFVRITHFDGVGTHATFEPVTCDGDFRVRVPVHILTDAAWNTLISGSNARLGVSSAPAGTPRAVLFGLAGAANVITGADAIVVGLTSMAELVRKGDRISIEIDGVERAAASGPEYAVPITFSCFGKNISGLGGADWLHGCYPAPVEIHDAGELVGRYRIDRPDHVLKNDAPRGALGNEKLSDAQAVVDQAVDLEFEGLSATYTVKHTWGQRQFKLPTALTPGCSYLISVEFQHWGNVGVYFKSAEASSPIGWKSNGYHGCYKTFGAGPHAVAITIPSDADVSGAFIAIAAGPTGTKTTTALSMKKAPGWGMVHNPSADAVKRYRVDDGDLVVAASKALLNDYNLNGWVNSVFTGHNTGQNTVSLRPGSFSAPLSSEHAYRLRCPLGDFLSVNLWGNQIEFAVPVSEEDAVADWLRAEIRAGRPLDIKPVIPASPLYKLRRRIEKLLKNKAGKVRPIPRFRADEGMFGDIPGWNTTGKFELVIRAEAKSGNGDNAAMLSLKQDSGNFLQYVYDDIATEGRFKVSTNGQTPGYGNIPFTNGELHDCSLIWDGTAFRTTVNGDHDYTVTPGVSTWVNDPFTQVRIGRNFDDTQIWDGHISHVGLIDLDNPLGNSRLYLMDDATGILYDALAEKGDDLLAARPYLRAGSCTIDGNTITAGADSWAYIGKDFETEEGETYKVAASARTGSGANFYARAYDLIGATNIKTRLNNLSGEAVGFVFTAASVSTRVYLQRHGNMVTGETLEVLMLEAEKTPNAGTIENPPADAYPRFVYQGDHVREWLSPVLNKNADFSDGSDHWRANGAQTETTFITFENNACRVVSDGEYVDAAQDGVMTSGRTYRHEFEVDRITGLGQVYTGTNNYSFSTAGKHAFDTVTTVSRLIFKRAGACDYTVTQFITRELLKEARQ